MAGLACRGLWVAAVCALAAAAGCRRAPLADSTKRDASADQGAPSRGDGSGVTSDAPPDVSVDAVADLALSDGNDGADVPAGDLTAPPDAADARADAPGDVTADASPDSLADAPDAAADAPIDAPADATPPDAPADVIAPDGPNADGGDVRPEDQPCGPLHLNCAPFACDVARGLCKAICLGDTDCATGYPCSNLGLCGSREPATCAMNADCRSGFCAQGLCCESACTQTCRSCALPGSYGVCTSVPSGTPSPNAGCPAGTVCDGRDGCVPPTCAADTDCGRFHHCSNARCVPCVATCASSLDCTVGATCLDNNGCTICDVPHAGPG